MSKHKSADEKLGTSGQGLSMSNLQNRKSAQNQLSPAPPKSTNANNQFH